MNNFVEELFIDLNTLLGIIYFVCVYKYIGFKLSVPCLSLWGLYLVGYVFLFFIIILIKNNIEKAIIKG